MLAVAVASEEALNRLSTPLSPDVLVEGPLVSVVELSAEDF